MHWNIIQQWSNTINISLDWSEAKFQRPCQISLISEYDDIINDAAIYDMNSLEMEISGNFDGIEKMILWDKSNQLILGAISSLYYRKEINLGLHPLLPDPRTVVICEPDGSKTTTHIVLQDSVPSKISRREPSDISKWTRKRTYKETIEMINKTLEFVQYLQGDTEKALNDIRKLISSFRQDAVCLWDPYLDARDIMRTLYHYPSTTAKLYALGRYNRTVSSIHKNMAQNESMQFSEWKSEQIALFTDVGNNNLCLDLEFRVSRNVSSGGFHDRFLIFPNTDDGAKVWSLGASINALGTSHHILQSTSNPQMIVDEFFKFWNSINDADSKIWSSHDARAR